jgi:hypothetical protein
MGTASMRRLRWWGQRWKRRKSGALKEEPGRLGKVKQERPMRAEDRGKTRKPRKATKVAAP